MWNGTHHYQTNSKQEQETQQLNAVSALASFSQQQQQQGSFITRDPYAEAYFIAQQSQQQPMSRQFSDTEEPASSYGRTANGGYAPVEAAASYYTTNGNGGGAPYSPTAATTTAANSYSDITSTSTSPSYPSYAAESYAQHELAASPSESGYSSDAGGNTYSYATEPHQPYAAAAPRGKPEAMARALAASQLEADRQEAEQEPPPPRKSPKKTKATPKKSKKKAAPPPSVLSMAAAPPVRRSEYRLGEPVPPITEDQYANLDELMAEFCRVPLLLEFRRPVSLLHPDLSKSYASIVSLPVDLGHVSRGIRRREYKTCRDVRLDMWLVFSNCVKYNSHAGNKHASPSFVSIAQHLREYFNQLWQECMLPSELPTGAGELLKVAFEDRQKDRQSRLDSTGVLVLHNSFLVQLAKRLSVFLDRGGCVDRLDPEPIFQETGGDTEVDIVVQRLREFQRQLHQHAQDAAVEYQLVQLYGDLRRCYTEDVLEEDPAVRHLFSNRIERFLWRQCTSLHEANSRGVTQSSIWGNIAACIWARESSKKAYWPAICLGILPPPEQGEGWHHAVTERNEGRLPHNLRGPLAQAKKQCEKNQKRAKHSYFLVEFLGTHEFTWVRETDIVENFDPDPSNDPNKKPAAKKGRASRSSAANAVGSKMYQKAIEECVFANNEYESVLNDAMSNLNGANNDEAGVDDDDISYNYTVLAQSDDEADLTESHGFDFAVDALNDSDVEEINQLLDNNGALDIAAIAKKSAKKKPVAAKKKVAAAKEETSTPAKKVKGEKIAKDKNRVDKKEQRELDRRRKKRTRDREKALRLVARKKRRRTGPDGVEIDDGYDLSFDKKSRASTIVKAYLMRLSKKEEGKSLALSGVLTMPAAMVDSTGVLGATLAFRAAAGMLRMPDDGKEAEEKRRPWMALNPATPKATQERTDLLKEKIALMQKQLHVVRSDTQRRQGLASTYGEKMESIESRVNEEDILARQNTFKKKPTKKAPSKAVKSPKKKEVKAAPSEEMASSDVNSEVIVEVEGDLEELMEEEEDGSRIEHSEVEVDIDEQDVESIANDIQDSEASVEAEEMTAELME